MIKPRLLFFPFPLLSHYTRCLMLAQDIQDHFEILFAHSEKYLPFINDFGFSTFTCKNFDAEEVMSYSRRFDFSWMKEELLEKIFQDQVNVIRQHNPIAVIGDASFTLKMAAEKAGTKMISVLNGYMTRYYAETRKISRSHPAYAYSQKLPVTLFDWITRTMEGVAFRKVHTPFQMIRRKYGLRLQKHYLNELEGDFTLIADLPELFPQKKLPSNIITVGPLYFQTVLDEGEIIRQLSSEKPSILISLGSSGNWRALKHLNDHRFNHFNIITSGDDEQVLNAKHIISKKFLNNMAVLPHCNLMICHGGNGTIYQALANDVPVLAHTSIFEQEWNMCRVEEKGWGESINDVSSEEKLLQIIMKWIERRGKLTAAEKFKEYNAALRKSVLLNIIR